jgi:hypothetical protein
MGMVQMVAAQVNTPDSDRPNGARRNSQSKDALRPARPSLCHAKCDESVPRQIRASITNSCGPGCVQARLRVPFSFAPSMPRFPVWRLGVPHLLRVAPADRWARYHSRSSGRQPAAARENKQGFSCIFPEIEKSVENPAGPGPIRCANSAFGSAAIGVARRGRGSLRLDQYWSALKTSPPARVPKAR